MLLLIGVVGTGRSCIFGSWCREGLIGHFQRGMLTAELASGLNWHSAISFLCLQEIGTRHFSFIAGSHWIYNGMSSTALIWKMRTTWNVSSLQTYTTTKQTNFLKKKNNTPRWCQVTKILLIYFKFFLSRINGLISFFHNNSLKGNFLKVSI
jgi:hypothetical protein